MRTTLKKILPYWPPMFVVLLLGIDVLYIRLQQLPFDQNKIDYGLVLLYRNTAFYVVLAAVVGFVGMLGYILHARWRISRSRDVIYVLSITVLFFVAIPSSAWAALSLIAEGGGVSFVHLDRLTVNGELYQLAFMGQPFYGQSSYDLYHCDSLGITCERVYQVDTSNGTPYVKVGYWGDARTARIVSDGTHNGLSIVVGATAIGDYSPEQKPPL